MSTPDLVILFQPARRRSRRRQNCAFASRRFLNSGESTAQWQDVPSKISDISFKIYKYCTFRVRSIEIECLFLNLHSPSTLRLRNSESQNARIRKSFASLIVEVKGVCAQGCAVDPNLRVVWRQLPNHKDNLYLVSHWVSKPIQWYQCPIGISSGDHASSDIGTGFPAGSHQCRLSTPHKTSQLQ